jgi:hypothetical protein
MFCSQCKTEYRVGTIVFGTANPTTGLQRVSASGGEETVLTRPDPKQGEKADASICAGKPQSIIFL